MEGRPKDTSDRVVEGLSDGKNGRGTHSTGTSRSEWETGKRPNKVRRIGQQTRGLFDDFSSWVELRLRLFQLDVQDRVQKKVDEAFRTAAIKGAPIIVGLLTGLFALVTAALFIGWALGHPAWGFLVVTGLLGLITAGMFARSRRLDRERAEVDVTEEAATDSSASNGQSTDRPGLAAHDAATDR